MAIQRAGRFSRIKKPLKSEMNVVPYIDVMLVLLVIFMVTAPMISSSLKVDLPKANSTPIESNEPPAIVSLQADGNYYLQYKDYNNDEPMPLEDIEKILTDAHAENVLVNGDQSRPYGDVVSLMARLQSAGLSQVGLMTDPVK